MFTARPSTEGSRLRLPDLDELLKNKAKLSAVLT